MQKKRQGKMSERQRKKLKNMKTQSNLSQIKRQPAGSKRKKIWRGGIEVQDGKI